MTRDVKTGAVLARLIRVSLCVMEAVQHAGVDCPGFDWRVLDAAKREMEAYLTPMGERVLSQATADML